MMAYCMACKRPWVRQGPYCEGCGYPSYVVAQDGASRAAPKARSAIRQSDAPNPEEVVKTLEKARLFLTELLSRIDENTPRLDDLAQEGQKLLGSIDHVLDGTAKPSPKSPDVSFY